MSELFEQLESNDKEVVENAKQQLRQQFKNVTESWLLNGIYDYYLKSKSVRAMDVLVTITEPHYNTLFERLCDSLKSTQEVKVQALTLLGHIARSQPTWLYNLPDHNLFRDVLKLLKNEVELLPLISALLVLIVLLPVLPSKMAIYLPDLFEIFSRLASWNCNPGKFGEDQMIHMQVALYALFLRLYGMFPCNFLAYLRSQYKDKNNPVFIHTIKPMLGTVKMHPLLVTASKENETTTERWKKMGVHDVIVECERFSLDMTDRCPHDSCQFTSGFRSRSGTTNSTMEPSYHVQNLKSLASVLPNQETFFTPTKAFHLQTPPVTETTAPTAIPQPHIQGVITSSNFPSQEGTSPPEAAIEATPETTPIRDFLASPGKNLASNSNTIRALTSLRVVGGSLHTTPTHSQPSSPMRRDSSAFNFPEEKAGFRVFKKESCSTQKVIKLIQERTQFMEPMVESQKINIPQPSSPLRKSNIELKSRLISQQRTESPVSQEDEEVSSIVSKTDICKQVLRECDSVLHDFDTVSDDIDDEQEHGSPCAAGGLHIPNSKSLMTFAINMKRLRYHSQCNTEPEKTESSTGSSPGNCLTFPKTSTVRRTNSWPDMRSFKGPTVVGKEKRGKPFQETDEETMSDDKSESRITLNGIGDLSRTGSPKKKTLTSATQTESFWPYEFLFLGIFPMLESNEVKPSPAPSPAPFSMSQDRFFAPSIYDILDKYIETAIQGSDRDSLSYVKEQLQLVHQELLFERHRRETHAYRNRRLLSDAKNTRLLEEYNSALRDQVQLQQKDIDTLRMQLERVRSDKFLEERRLIDKLKLLEQQCKALQDECTNLKEANQSLESEVKSVKNKCAELDIKRQEAESSLLDAVGEVTVFREQAMAGDKGRIELEQLNRELLLVGELQLKFQERLNRLSSMKKSEEELEHLKEVYNHEVKELNSQLNSKISLLEAYRSRITELEQHIVANEENVLAQKREISHLSEENYKKTEAIESKYQTQLRINRALEERLLDFRQKLEFAKKTVNSPDTSSCHEVTVTTTDRTAGLSAHSSPLSASLASSEGSVAFHDVREIRNLQALVDQKEPTTSKMKHAEEFSMGTSNSDGQLSSSTSTTKHD